MNKVTKTTYIFVSLFVVLVLATVAGADDVILVPGAATKVPGNRVRGTIQAETPTEVRVEGQQTPIPVEQIASINYTGQPASMTLAESREAGGAVSEAADYYAKAATEAAGKDLIVRAAQFGRVHVLADQAQGDPTKAAQAIEALEGFIKANPSARQLGPALEALARISVQKEDYDRAAKALADLSKIPWAADRSAVLQARVLSRRGQFDQAIVALDRMLANAPKDSAKFREAQLAKAESQAGLKKFDEAEATVLAVIKAAPAEDAEAQALAYNTLGDCLRAADKPKDALLAYLHTDVLFAKDKEQHARALSQITQLWRVLRRDDRAEETLERLKQDYPNSPWVSAAAAKK